MAKWKVLKHYRSDWGTLSRNSIVDLDDDVAAWLLRDSPGCIEKVQPPRPEPPKTRAPEKPASTRQVKKPAAKRTTDDGE